MRLYVLVSNDLPSRSYQAVQAGHALAQFCLDHHHAFGEWKNNYLIYLRVESEDKLIQLYEELKEDECIHTSLFKEPDLGNATTAMAVMGPGLSQRLQNFNLL